MSIDTTKLPGWTCAEDITTTFGAASNTVTKVVVYRYGAVIVFQFTMSDSSTLYLKTKQGRVSVGGPDNLFSSGTEVIWAA